MGIDVRLENEQADPLKWASNSLPKYLKFEALSFRNCIDFPLSGSIDPYGDTIFNRLQAPQLLHEWDLLTAKVDDSDRVVMDEVARLIEECRDGVHLYIRFIGD